MISTFTSQYLPPLLGAIIVLLALVLIVAGLSRRSRGSSRLWRGIVQQRVALGFLCAAILFIVAFITFVVRSRQQETELAAVVARETATVNSPANLLIDPSPLAAPDRGTPALLWALQGSSQFRSNFDVDLQASSTITSHVIIVCPGCDYRYSFDLATDATKPPAQVQVRLTWYDGHIYPPLSWDDSPPLKASSTSHFQTAVRTAPPGATRLVFTLKNTGPGGASVRSLKLSQQGVYIEPHPNGTQGALAFSFDWESAMGGAVHSQGMEGHDVVGAAEHGLLMRQGADWLNKLFQDNNVHATFYATGYNLLDGNTERRTFSGDPLYKWAAPKNNWQSTYWLTHKWFSDDPFGTYQSDPAWYFGDQTRSLLAAGDEIAPHTFGHLYVRGSTPTELATDMDEWLKAAKAAGVPPPTTFAFPWRSSNSLTPDFYNVLYARGVRAVTRLYAPDLRDLYTLGAAPVYSYVAVMPDFLLGTQASNAGEEGGGAPIGLDQGLRVISETLARRGTTSFWNHPEQLGNNPALQPVRDAWTAVVQSAARERDAGRLWIATVADITAYQRDVMSVTVRLTRNDSGLWDMIITNNSGHDINGLTLTLPGEAARLYASNVEFNTVTRQPNGDVRLSPAGQPSYPARQVVVSPLTPRQTYIDIEWAAGQEPLQ